MIRRLLRFSFAALALLCAVLAVALAVAWPVSYERSWSVTREVKPPEGYQWHFLYLESGRVIISSITEPNGPAITTTPEWNIDTYDTNQETWTYFKWDNVVEKVWSFMGFEWARTISEEGSLYRALAVPCSYLVIVLSLSPAAWLLLWHRNRRSRQRSRAGLCPTCGYDLRASPNRCPECGTAATGAIP